MTLLKRQFELQLDKTHRLAVTTQPSEAALRTLLKKAFALGKDAEIQLKAALAQAQYETGIVRADLCKALQILQQAESSRGVRKLVRNPAQVLGGHKARFSKRWGASDFPIAFNRAKVGWGEPLPDWVATLAAEADKTSQSKVAKCLGMSTATINQVLGNVYPGRVRRIEAEVRKKLLPAGGEPSPMPQQGG